MSGEGFSSSLFKSLVTVVGPVELWATRQRRPSAAANPRASRPLSASRRSGMLDEWLVVDRLDEASDCPDKTDHLAGDRGGGHDTGLAQCRQPAVPRTQPDLCFPRDIAYFCGQRLETVVQLAADPRLHAICPSSFDQHAPGQGVAGLGNAAATNGGAR